MAAEDIDQWKEKNIENAARTKVFVLAAYTAGEAAALSAHGIKNL